MFNLKPIILFLLSVFFLQVSSYDVRPAPNISGQWIGGVVSAVGMWALFIALLLIISQVVLATQRRTRVVFNPVDDALVLGAAPVPLLAAQKLGSSSSSPNRDDVTERFVYYNRGMVGDDGERELAGGVRGVVSFNPSVEIQKIDEGREISYA